MIDKAQLDSILESALRALIAKRCNRAYIHEFRNSLQTVYVGIDMVARLLDGKAGAVSQDRVLQMSRRAIQGHEQALTGTLQHLVGHGEELCTVDTAAVLRELAAFLNNDAAARGIAIRLTGANNPLLMARPENFRLVLLSVLTHAIDAMNSGGEIQVAVASGAGDVAVNVVLVPAVVNLSDGGQWHFGEHEPSNESWMLYATRNLVLGDGGEIESHLDTQDARGLRVVQLRYQAAKPSSLDAAPSPDLPSD